VRASGVHQGGNLQDNRLQLNGFDGEPHLAGLDLRYLDQFIHQRQQVGSGRENVVCADPVR
jgi:hypothetical protein